MPDGGVGEAELAATLFETAAADDAAFGAAALAGGATEAAVTGGVVDAALGTAVGEGLAAGTEVGTAATADTALAGGASGVVPGNPAAQALAGADAQKESLAKKVLQPETPAPADYNVGTSGTAAGADYGTVPPEKPGIIDSATQWAQKNPVAATIVGTQLAGAVGGVGKAALEKEIAERNIRARSSLLTQQTQEQLDLSRRGTFTGNVNVKPAANKILRRPDGTPVYGPGIITGQTGGA